MIHTIYSNSYEVLRAVLLSNVEALHFVDEDASVKPDEADFCGKTAEALFPVLFERTPVIIPSRAVGADLARAVAKKSAVCAAMDFMLLSEWLGFFSKAPLANILGNEADWMIWRILKEEGSESFRAQVRAHDPHSRLEKYLRGKTDREIFALARHIANVFVSYCSYRLDWVLEWLGLHGDLIAKGPEYAAERRKLESHPDFFWQRLLFQKLAEAPGWLGKRCLDAFPGTLERLARSGKNVRNFRTADGRRQTLPSSLHVFMPFVVPPVMLPVLKAYAYSGRDVWLYLLNPCAEYWFDLVPQRLFDWEAAASENSDDKHKEVGHPMLADNAQSTRSNIDRLWRFTAGAEAAQFSAASEAGGAERTLRRSIELGELDAPSVREPEKPEPRHFLSGIAQLAADQELKTQSYYLEARDPALLRRVQDSILKLAPDLLDGFDGPITSRMLFREEDDSLRFLAAPTAARELEGLADWLHAQFERDHSLKADDVLVATPDISAAAPLIEKVFGGLSDERRIDFRIAGAREADADAPAAALVALIDLLAGRAKRADVEALLAMPPVAKRFGVSADDLSIVSNWLHAAGFRSGISAEHLMHEDPITFSRVQDATLASAIERLALGFMIPEASARPFDETVPIRGAEEEGWTSTADRPDLLITLADFAAKLDAAWRAAVPDAENAPQYWVDWIAKALEAFFPRESIEDDYSIIRSQAAAAAEEIAKAWPAAETDENDVQAAAPFAGPAVSFDLFMTALKERFQAESRAARPGSCVTFAGMSDLRGIPYKVIAVIGLNQDCSFPGAAKFEEFDLMAAAPRRGDRDSRVDNRNVFLDLMLAARERFLISYVCGMQAENKKGPSVVAAELLNWLLAFAKGKGEKRRVEKLLTTELPLHNFSSGNFRKRAGAWQSTDAKLLAAVAEAESKGYAADEPVFADRGLSLAEKKGFESARAAKTMSRAALKDIWSFWRQSADWTLRQFRISLPAIGGGADLPMIRASSGLDKWKSREAAIEALLAGRHPSTLVEARSVDPRCGAAGIREWKCREDVQFVLAMFDCAKSRLRNMVPADDMSIEVKLAKKDLGGRDPVIITHRLTGLWKSAETADNSGDKRDNACDESVDKLLVFDMLPSCKGSFSIGKVFAAYAAAAAAGIPIQGAVVLRDEGDAPALHAFAPISKEAAKRCLAALYRGYALTAERAAVLPNGSSNGDAWPNANLVLFRGMDEEGIADIRGKLDKLLKEIWTAKDADALEAHVDDFSKIVSEL